MSIRSMTPRLPLSGTGPAVRLRARRVVELLFLWEERHRMRRRLAAADDRMLSDIGVGRADAAIEADKPFWRP